MALVVEDGTGKSDADSYLSVADADAYDAKYTNDSDWQGATTLQKEIALRRATQWIDNEYRGRWSGTPTNAEQALSWPRIGAYDSEDRLVPSDELPQDLKDATAEMAIRSLAADPQPDPDSAGEVVKQKVAVEGISEELEYSEGVSAADVEYPKVQMLLDQYTVTGAGGTGSRELERA